MVTAGIIAEFNPFHNGHYHLIQEARRQGADCIVVVMSGHVTQRGAFPILDKWTRSKAALVSGADLVLELPAAGVLSSAEGFAQTGVDVLNQLGCVDLLVFGSECGELSLLQQAALAMEVPDFGAELRARMAQGVSYPRALQQTVQAVSYHSFADDVLCSPNNILGIEYLRALTHTQSAITPITVPRLGVDHDANATSQGFSSAKALRKNMDSQLSNWASFIPSPALEVYLSAIQRGKGPCSAELPHGILLSLLRGKTAKEIARSPACGEGLENRLYKAVWQCATLEDVIEYTKSKRYPLSRIRRMVFSTALGIPNRIPRYIRVLGHNAVGRECLRQCRGGVVPMVQRASQAKAADPIAFATDCRITGVFAQGLPVPLPQSWELTENVVYLP